MTDTKKRVSICTLGCRANQYESDAIAAALSADGFSVVPFGEEADLAIVNTCSVTAESDRKSRQMIRRSHAPHVIVTGCFAELSPEEAREIDGVDAVIGNRNKSKVIDAAREILAGTVAEMFTPEEFEPCNLLSGGRARRARSYIKIEDGCDKRCSYCIISTARGPVRSKLPEDVIAEAQALVKLGVCEVILTGIETASYGKDLSGYGLYELIRDISKVDGVKRIGMGSLDPSSMKGDFPEKLSEISKVLPHFHISLQSGCSRILREMRRRYNADQAREFISNIRRYFPEAMLSCDIITGFPGETEEDFRETVEFLRETKFLHAHIFPYSERGGTVAAEMPNKVPVSIRKERANELVRLDLEIKHDLLCEYIRKHVDKGVSVLIEKEENGFVTGHSEHFVEILARGDKSLVGKICNVTLTERIGERCFGKIEGTVED